jgi:hypothetical protein
MARISFARMVAGAAVATVIACGTDAPATAPSDPAGGGQGIVAGDLVVTARAPELTLSNQTEWPVGYAIYDKDLAIVALVPPCGERCARIDQGERVVVRYQDIPGHTATSREAVLFWWTQLPGQTTPSLMQTKVVRLR